VLGFLRKLAGVYSIDEGMLSKQYKKEKSIQNQMQKSRAEARLKRTFFKGLVVTPKLMSIFLGFLFVAVTVIYVVWQVASINQYPNLDIYQPQDRQLIKGSLVAVAGKTDPGMSVEVNGQEVFVDSGGNFKTQISIEPGPTELRVTAKNKFEKTTAKIIGIIGEQEAGAPQGQVQLKLEFSGDANISVIIDNGTSQAFGFHAGDVKIFLGQKQISVSTSNAGVTKATLNGQVLGSLGRPGENLSSIPFYAESSSTPQ
jgi:cytoskeletal protein RodZ